MKRLFVSALVASLIVATSSDAGPPLSLDAYGTYRNIFGGANLPSCSLGDAGALYDFAGKVLSPSGDLDSMAVSKVSCLACEQDMAFSGGLSGDVGHCDRSDDLVWSYVTNCIDFGQDTSLGTAAGAVFNCQSRGGSGQYCNNRTATCFQ